MTGRHNSRGAALAGAVLLLLGGAAQAQTNTPAPSAPARQGAAPGGSGNAQGGVITPPAGVDPDIRTTVPDPAPRTKPVNPPPGTPGGNPSVQPR